MSTQFEKVINDLKARKKITRNMLADALSSETGMTIKPYKINRYKNGIDTVKQPVIDAMQKLYNVNPDFLKNESSIMYCTADIQLEKFLSLVKDCKIVESNHRNNNNAIVTNKYLHLTMEKNLYDFIVNYYFVNSFKEYGLQCLGEELQKYRKKYNESIEKEECEYVLLPAKHLYEIISDENNKKLMLNELLDLFSSDDDINL